MFEGIIKPKLSYDILKVLFHLGYSNLLAWQLIPSDNIQQTMKWT